MLHFPARNPARTHNVSADAVLHQLANVDRPPTASIHLDIRRLGGRPPAFAFGLLERSQGLRRLLGGVIWMPSSAKRFSTWGSPWWR